MIHLICPVCGWKQDCDGFLENHFKLYHDNDKWHPLTCMNGCGKMQEDAE
jgi:hypothetical protein